MASVGESVANSLSNAGKTVLDMEADKRDFQLCLEKFIRAYEAGEDDQIKDVYTAAIVALENRRL